VEVKVRNTFLLMVFSCWLFLATNHTFVHGLENKRTENDMRIPAGAPFILNRTAVSRIRIPLVTKMYSRLPRFVISWKG
jgi:hypothetical protein